MKKAAIVIFAELESHQNMARAVNALEVAREFKEAGDDVQIIFDEGGTVAAVAVADPAHQMHGLYAAVEGKVAGVCRYCARAFGVYDKAESLHLPMLAEYRQHPSLRSRVADGYSVLVF
jgi:hypothetical protein